MLLDSLGYHYFENLAMISFSFFKKGLPSIPIPLVSAPFPLPSFFSPSLHGTQPLNPFQFQLNHCIISPALLKMLLIRLSNFLPAQRLQKRKVLDVLPPHPKNYSYPFLVSAHKKGMHILEYMSA